MYGHLDIAPVICVPKFTVNMLKLKEADALDRRLPLSMEKWCL
jgi:hypothetical protein